jgi:hypothetical protein
MSQFVSSHSQLHLRNKEMQPWLEVGFNKHNKIIFDRWVDKNLDESLIKQNIKVGFRVTRKGP